MFIHPFGNAFQCLDRAFVKTAAGIGAHVQKQVPGTGNVTDQHGNQTVRSFPGGFVPVITPRTGESLAAFPRYQIAVAVGIAHTVTGDILLGALEVAGAIQSQTVVDKNIRSQTADEFQQFFAFPLFRIFAAGTGVGEVKPHHVDLTVIGQQFPHLIAHIFAIFVLIAGLVEFIPILIAQRVVVVDGELVVVPVQQRVIKTGADAFGAERIQSFADIVAVGLEISISRIPHTETVVVLGGHNHIFHTSSFGKFCPLPGFKAVGGEVSYISFAVFFGGNLFDGLHPFTPGGYAVNAPVNKHTKTCCLPPTAVTVRIFFAHNRHSFVYYFYVQMINLILKSKSSIATFLLFYQ